nr:MAG TPA: hypothetical protein [Caudoviricetes sp.]
MCIFVWFCVLAQTKTHKPDKTPCLWAYGLP